MRKYKVYIDENLPPQLAKGLHELQSPQNKRDNIEIQVLSIKDTFGQGEQDEDWIPKVGAENGIVITQDYRIQSQRHQKELYIEYGVGILFFNTPSKSGFQYWDLVKLVINRWEEIKQIIKKDDPPFAYRCTSRKSFEKIED
jgi:hypothetical protein